MLCSTQINLSNLGDISGTLTSKPNLTYACNACQWCRIHVWRGTVWLKWRRMICLYPLGPHFYFRAWYGYDTFLRGTTQYCRLSSRCRAECYYKSPSFAHAQNKFVTWANYTDLYQNGWLVSPEEKCRARINPKNLKHIVFSNIDVAVRWRFTSLCGYW